jgi:hypothetical protein
MPSATSGTAVSCSGGSRSTEAAAHNAISTSRPARSQRPHRTAATARWPDRFRLDRTANTEASATPIGVARVKPAFGVSSNTFGVASACNPRNPAADRNASDTNSTRGSPRRSAAAPVRYASTALSTAVINTSQKCDGWCSQCTSICGRCNSKTKPAGGTNRTNAVGAIIADV